MAGKSRRLINTLIAPASLVAGLLAAGAPARAAEVVVFTPVDDAQTRTRVLDELGFAGELKANGVDPAKAALEIAVVHFDKLSRTPDVFVRQADDGSCPAKGCPAVLYTRYSQGWASILQTTERTIIFAKKRTMGYPDLILGDRQARYDSRRYRISG